VEIKGNVVFTNHPTFDEDVRMSHAKLPVPPEGSRNNIAGFNRTDATRHQVTGTFLLHRLNVNMFPLFEAIRGDCLSELFSK
jgi:hypothetical protein